jgi:hydrogenase nickel incorporation protein HypA/HybF
MHEMSLCESMLRIMEEKARAEGFHQVRTVWLEIGALAGVEVEALRFCFDVVTNGSLAQDARLEIIDIPGEAWCMQCAKVIGIRQRFDGCPVCGNYQLQVTGGDEMRIKELEVE